MKFCYSPDGELILASIKRNIPCVQARRASGEREREGGNYVDLYRERRAKEKYITFRNNGRTFFYYTGTVNFGSPRVVRTTVSGGRAHTPERSYTPRNNVPR